MSPDDPSTTLTVGARYACFACRTRGVAAGRCRRCDRALLELGTPAAQDAVLAIISTLSARRHAPPGTARIPRVHRVATHVFALACAVIAALLAAKIHTNGYVPRGAVMAVGAGLGLIAGYVIAATGGVIAFVAAASFAVCAVSLALIRAGAVALASFALGRRGPALRARTLERLDRDVRAALGPVRLVRRERAAARDRGHVVRFLRAPDPSAIEIDAGTSLEGELVDSGERVAIGTDVTGMIVGAEGITLGAGLADARVAPLLVRAADGRLTRVVVDCGTVVVRASSGRAMFLGSSGPVEWGLPPLVGNRWSRRRVPPGERVTVFVVEPGARVRVEGGVARDEMVQAPASWGRAGEFGRAVHGTVESPLRVIVLADGPAR